MQKVDKMGVHHFFLLASLTALYGPRWLQQFQQLLCIYLCICMPKNIGNPAIRADKVIKLK